MSCTSETQGLRCGGHTAWDRADLHAASGVTSDGWTWSAEWSDTDPSPNFRGPGPEVYRPETGKYVPNPRDWSPVERARVTECRRNLLAASVRSAENVLAQAKENLARFELGL